MKISETPDNRDLIAIENEPQLASTLLTDFVQAISAVASIKNHLYGQGGPGRFTFAVLFKLWKSGPLRSSDLAEALRIDPSTTSRQVALLVQDGLLERQVEQNDRRSSVLNLTLKGLDQIERMTNSGGEILEAVIADWSAEDRQTFGRLMHDFASKLSGNVATIQNSGVALLRPDPVQPQEMVGPEPAR